jgi:hypothetical protein
MGVFDEVKENAEVQKAIALFTKVAIYGAVVVGTLLFVNKIFGFTFDLKIGLGL